MCPVVARSRFHRLLARMMDYLDQESWRASEAAARGEPKPPSLYAQYVQPGYAAYEVEHVWADHFERHVQEFGHEADFQAQRNRIGALLLMPGWVNNRVSDKTYAEKRQRFERLVTVNPHCPVAGARGSPCQLVRDRREARSWRVGAVWPVRQCSAASRASLASRAASRIRSPPMTFWRK